VIVCLRAKKAPHRGVMKMAALWLRNEFDGINVTVSDVISGAI
jgi:hypothetical protein